MAKKAKKKRAAKKPEPVQRWLHTYLIQCEEDDVGRDEPLIYNIITEHSPAEDLLRHLRANLEQERKDGAKDHTYAVLVSSFPIPYGFDAASLEELLDSEAVQLIRPLKP